MKSEIERTARFVNKLSLHNLERGEQAIKELIDAAVIRARIKELQWASDTLDNLHQGTEGAGFVHYGEMGEDIDDRLNQLRGSK